MIFFLGCFWYTDFWTFGFLDPPPPPLLKENSGGRGMGRLAGTPAPLHSPRGGGGGGGCTRCWARAPSGLDDGLVNKGRRDKWKKLPAEFRSPTWDREVRRLPPTLVCAPGHSFVTLGPPSGVHTTCPENQTGSTGCGSEAPRQTFVTPNFAASNAAPPPPPVNRRRFSADCRQLSANGRRFRRTRSPGGAVNSTGNSPVSGTADPRSSQTGQVIRGLRCHNQHTFGPTEGQNERWREANWRRQRQTYRHHGLVPTGGRG